MATPVKACVGRGCDRPGVWAVLSSGPGSIAGVCEAHGIAYIDAAERSAARAGRVRVMTLVAC